MPNSWAMIDTSFPTFTGQETYREQVGKLQDYLFLVVEELKYQLANLNTQNWNKTALQRLQEETVAPTNEEVAALAEKITQIQNRLTLFSSALNDITERVGSCEEETVKLWEGLELLAGDVDSLNGIIQPDDSGGATIGAEGKDIRLVGNVYINGILMGQEA